ncbi:flagellar hook-length control protein FliK [Frigoribacterium faeni]|nr:flagellar hook-length control protein FliK [Frigoribacterium faeni]MBA8814716.1 flagellar hook-length control protein FliK [Frigoribacterium faeni]
MAAAASTTARTAADEPPVTPAPASTLAAATAAAPAAAPAAPAVAPAPAPAAASAASAAPAPLAQQLARPLFTLAAAGHGTHTVTVTVAPDALGPVTVRAHVSASGMQIEMFAASDAGRDAVRSIIPDLRRDMGGAGLQTSIDLSSQNQPSDPRGQHGAAAFSDGRGSGPTPDRGLLGDATRASSAADGGTDGTDGGAAAAPRDPSHRPTSLDVLA